MCSFLLFIIYFLWFLQYINFVCLLAWLFIFLFALLSSIALLGNHWDYSELRCLGAVQFGAHVEQAGRWRVGEGRLCKTRWYRRVPLDGPYRLFPVLLTLFFQLIVLFCKIASPENIFPSTVMARYLREV